MLKLHLWLRLVWLRLTESSETRFLYFLPLLNLVWLLIWALTLKQMLGLGFPLPVHPEASSLALLYVPLYPTSCKVVETQ